MKKLLLIALLTISAIAYENHMDVEDLNTQDALICSNDRFHTVVDRFLIVKARTNYVIDLDTKQAYPLVKCVGIKQSEIIARRFKSRLK